VPGGLSDRFHPVGRLGHHLELLVKPQGVPQEETDVGCVVGHEDPDGVHWGHADRPIARRATLSIREGIGIGPPGPESQAEGARTFRTSSRAAAMNRSLSSSSS
jgi:hypothetical protein